MNQGTEPVARVYNALQSLRGRCFELLHGGRDADVTRLIEDLAGQHARQASEIAVLLSGIGASAGPVPASDGAAGEEHAPPPEIPLGLNRNEVNVLPALIEAERALVLAYDAALERQPEGSPFVSLLARHRVALTTALQRIEALAT